MKCRPACRWSAAHRCVFTSETARHSPSTTPCVAASGGVRSKLDAFTKPVLDVIGGEDSRRKATTDAAASIGVYETPSAANPSPIVMDSFSNLSQAFAALISVTDIDHFDLVDDPFVVAYRAQGGITRTGAFDPNKSYVLRPLEERQQIRDHYVLATMDVFLKGAGDAAFRRRAVRHAGRERHGRAGVRLGGSGRRVLGSAPAPTVTADP